jgi:hypothetical protein
MNTHLEDRLGAALNDLAADRPFALDLDSIERRGRRANRRTALTRSGVTLTVAAVVAAAVGIGTVGQNSPVSRPSAGAAVAGKAAAAAPLTRLADYVLAGVTHPAGDATKVIRTTTVTGEAPTVGADLFADNGKYFYSDDAAALPALVKTDQNVANGVFGRDVAIAQFAANGGDLATAQKRMAAAAMDPGTPYNFVAGEAPSPFPAGLTGAQKKEYVMKLEATNKTAVVDFDDTWSNSLDALIAGAGRPDVRAGVVRILSTLPTVTVSDTTTDGKPTLTVSNTEVLSSGSYVESIVIGAKDGVPVKLYGGDEGKPLGVTINYQVSRVTLSTLG